MANMSKSLRIYIAGPMRGIPNFNFPAFFDAEERLMESGHQTFNPARRDEQKYGKDVGKSSTGNEDEAASTHGFSLREALAADTQWISLHADAVATLPGWENSKGAQAEVALANALGLKVAPVEGFVEVVAYGKP